jgi:HEAT repeat protein
MAQPRLLAGRTRWLMVASAFALVLVTGVPLYEALVEPVEPDAPISHRSALNPRARAAVEAVLLPRAVGPEPTLESMVRDLVALKAPAIPVLIAIACGEEELSEFAIGTKDAPVHPRAIELRQQAIAGALRELPAPQVAASLREWGVGAPLDMALVAAQFLGDCADPTALDTLVEIARAIEPIQLRRTYVNATLQTALAKHFARTPLALEQLELRGPDDAWPVFVHAASASRTTTSARWLAELLGRDRELDLAVVEELGRSAEGGRFALPEEVVERLRDTLPRADDQMRRLAAIALGNAREGQAFDDLVELLDETDPLIALAARHGLAAITGADLGADPGAWLDWRVAQEAWYAEHSAALLEQLADADPARASAAMGELLSRGFFRHEWAHEIGARLFAAEGPLFATACASVAALGSSRAVPWLVEALERVDVHERELARGALRALTGLELPAERAAWLHALEL